MVVILRVGWEFLGAAVLYWLPESGPFENHLALKEIGRPSVWLNPLAYPLRTLKPREVDVSPVAAQLV